MIITISGSAGSGKSTMARIMLKKLNAKRVYVGGIRRELARSKGMSLEELNVYGQKHPETDVDVDKAAAAKARELSLDGSNVIVEGRVMYHFLPESLKIFLKTDVTVAAKRIFLEMQDEEAKAKRNEGEPQSVEELEKSILRREESDAMRYKKYYGIDHRLESNYDYVLDTTDLSVEQVTDKVMEFLESKKVKIQEKAYKWFNLIG